MNERLYTPKRLKEILDRYNIRPKKSLGQNFFIDGNLLKKMVDMAEIDGESVLEIGAGIGTLTEELAIHARDVISYEIDNSLKEVHKETLPYSNIKIIYEDFLKSDLKLSYGTKVVANLPYYISSKILVKLLDYHHNIDSITILTQKEMAERILGESISSISILVAYYTDHASSFKVPKDSFYPMPKVESVAFKLKIKKDLPEVPEMFFSLIRNAFLMKRKTLANNLLKSRVVSNRNEIEKILKALNLPQDIRGEDLTLKDFIRLSWALFPSSL